MKGAQSIRIAHIITALEVGGAELKLYRLLKYLESNNTQNFVISLAEVGAVGERIKELGVPVVSVGIRSGKVPSLCHVFRLLRTFNNIKPDVVQGWMYHGNLAATIAWFFHIGRGRLFWNIRQSLGDIEDEAPLTRKVIRINAWLSRFPESIIYNSRDSAKQHETYGFVSSKTVYIPNGFDIGVESGGTPIFTNFRKEQLLSNETFLVGHIARFHPKKDHQTLICAVHYVAGKRKNVVFVAIGREIIDSNEELANPIARLGLQKHVLLLGERNDIDDIMGSLDLLVSTSAWGEGFPNVVGEAMSVGVPCVVTNVGESGHLVGSSGYIVEPRDSHAIGEAILSFLDMSAEEQSVRSTMARERIASNFSMERIGRRYLDLYY